MRRVVAFGLAVFSTLGLMGTGSVPGLGGTAAAAGNYSAETATGGRFPAAPLILIHGLGGSATAFEGPLQMGLEERLLQAGYVRDKTLFLLDYSEHNNGDYVHVAAAHLRPLVERALAVSGADRVDLLGYSMGGLVARYYLNLPEQAERVRTAVLLASPARGSFAADIVKDAMVSEAYRLNRPKIDSPLSLQTAEQVVGGQSAGFLDPRPPRPWSQQQYVFRQALEVFEPRLQIFLLKSKFGRNAAPLTSFLAWLKRERRDDHRALFAQAERPPLPPGEGKDPAAQGMDLTSAYLNGLALNAARTYMQQHLTLGRPVTANTRTPRTVGTATGPSGPSGPGTISPADLLRRVTSWLGIDPHGAAIDRLLAERFSPAPGETYLANYFLHLWNDLDGARRLSSQGPGDGAGQSQPRYVVVAGTMPNLYSPWWPAVRANDGAVEADSAWLPLNLQDAFYLFEGSLLSASHPALKLNPQVFDRILAELAPEPRAARRVSPLVRRWWWRDIEWEEDGGVELARWTPTYLDVDTARLKGRSGRLTIEVEAGARGVARLWQSLFRMGATDRSGDGVRVWVDQAPGEKAPGPAAVPLARAGTLWKGAYQVEDFGAATGPVRVGLRLDGAVPSLPANDHLTVRYRVRFDPGTAEEDRAGTGRTDPTGVGPAAGGSGQDQTPPGPGKPPGPGGSPGPTMPPLPLQPAGPRVARPTPPAAAPPMGPPEKHGPNTIWVRRWNRETTSRDPAEEAHAYWLWDFGDGTSFKDDDPSHVAGDLNHLFPGPGRYHVTATSVSNLGRALRQMAWDMSVPPSGTGLWPFAFETLHLPWLRLELEGPPKWLTGRPAHYRVRVESVPVPWVARQKVTVDPAREFDVAWEKPGTYVVRAAVTVDTTYRLPEGGTITIRGTYLVPRQVKVYTPGLADS